MADIFISYKREDRAAAERLASALEQLGFDVWWDFDLLSGEQYRKVIRAVIDQCKAAIVLWSSRAIESDFVVDEATHAKAQGKLCPARIDGVDLPFGFGSIHTDDLTHWEGELSHPGFQAMVRAVESRVGKKGRLGAAKPADAQAGAEELSAFKTAQLAANTSALRAFLATHPRGIFSSFVRAQLEGISDAERMSSQPVATQAPLPTNLSPETSPPASSAPRTNERDARQLAPRQPFRSIGLVLLSAVVVLGVGAIVLHDIFGWWTPQHATPAEDVAQTSPYDLHQLYSPVGDAVSQARNAERRANEQATYAHDVEAGRVAAAPGSRLAVIDNAAYTYAGQVDDNRVPSGYGVFAYHGEYEGQRYAGGVERGRYNGYGVTYLRDGRRYEGEKSDGVNNGYGVIWDANGEVQSTGLWTHDTLTTSLAVARARSN